MYGYRQRHRSYLVTQKIYASNKNNSCLHNVFWVKICSLFIRHIFVEAKVCVLCCARLGQIYLQLDLISMYYVLTF